VIADLLLLGTIHGLIGAPEQSFGGRAVGRVGGNADAGPHADPQRAGFQWCRYGVEQLARQVAQQLPIDAFRRQTRKFITTQSAHHVLGTNHSRKPRRNNPQQFVAGLIPIPVIDRLEGNWKQVKGKVSTR
jgi:hypothetical protein